MAVAPWLKSSLLRMVERAIGLRVARRYVHAPIHTHIGRIKLTSTWTRIAPDVRRLKWRWRRWQRRHFQRRIV